MCYFGPDRSASPIELNNSSMLAVRYAGHCPFIILAETSDICRYNKRVEYLQWNTRCHVDAVVVALPSRTSVGLDACAGNRPATAVMLNIAIKRNC